MKEEERQKRGHLWHDSMSLAFSTSVLPWWAGDRQEYVSIPAGVLYIQSSGPARGWGEEFRRGRLSPSVRKTFLLRKEDFPPL